MIKKDAYEMLVRWTDRSAVDKDPTVAGVSIKWRITGWNEDGTVALSEISNPESVSVAGQKGYPLADILEQAQADAFRMIDEHSELVFTVQTENSELQNRNKSLEAEFSGAVKVIGDRETELSEKNKIISEKDEEIAKLKAAHDGAIATVKTLEESAAAMTAKIAKSVETSAEVVKE